MDRVGGRRRHREPQHLAAGVEGARAGRRAAAVDVAQPPRDPRRAGVRHVDHRGREHRTRDGPHPARRRRVGGVQPRQAIALDRLGRVRGGDRAGRVHRPRGQRSACSASTSTRVAARPSRRSPTLKPLHPEIDGATVTAGQRGGAQRRRRRGRGHGRRLRGGARAARRWPASCRGRRRPRARAHRHRADAGDPEGARARRAHGRRHRPVRDQRGVLLGAGRGGPHARHRPDDRERERQRLQPRSPDRGDRRPDGRHHGQRAASPRARRSGASSMCAGGGMGSALVLEAL